MPDVNEANRLNWCPHGPDRQNCADCKADHTLREAQTRDRLRVEVDALARSIEGTSVAKGEPIQTTKDQIRDMVGEWRAAKHAGTHYLESKKDRLLMLLAEEVMR